MPRRGLALAGNLCASRLTPEHPRCQSATRRKPANAEISAHAERSPRPSGRGAQPRVRERGAELNPCADATGQFASKLAPTKNKYAFALAFGLPEKPTRTPKRPFRRPSETGAQEVMRHGCRESPAGYRDVPSGRASVAGEFVRVARLCRARMRGKPFWFLLWRLTKGTRPRGRNKKAGQTRSGAETPKPRQLGYPPSGQHKRCSRWSRVPRSWERRWGREA